MVPSERDYRASQAERLIQIVKDVEEYERHLHTLKCEKIEIEDKIESVAIEIMDLAAEYRDITGLSCNCEFMGVTCACEDDDETA